MCLFICAIKRTIRYTSYSASLSFVSCGLELSNEARKNYVFDQEVKNDENLGFAENGNWGKFVKFMGEIFLSKNMSLKI